MCIDCLAIRGSAPSLLRVRRAELLAGLDLRPTWVLRLKAEATVG
jgi:hypothetical protein